MDSRSSGLQFVASIGGTGNGLACWRCHQSVTACKCVSIAAEWEDSPTLLLSSQFATQGVDGLYRLGL
jgi:hypothetical protein